VHRDWVQGIPLVQSGSGGELFGRVDLVWNTEVRQIDITRTRAVAGIRLLHRGCSPQTEFQCREEPESGIPLLEGVRLENDATLSNLIESARAELAPTGDRILARAAKPLNRDRINESVLANILNDALLSASGTEISLLNTGGIRDSIPPGDINYAGFFRVLPFNNHAVILARMPANRLIQLLEKSVRTCGDYGALLPGGIRVEFERVCETPGSGKPESGINKDARLIRVTLSPSGEVLYDLEKGIQPSPERTFQFATLDFLAAGGSAYSEFAGLEISRDLGIFRELLVAEFLKSRPELSGEADGRWKNLR
jgi:2',3'-cyclic-nucleotide 2'-phosphodiesterase (5'-nucleotidase family)